jgi:nicotinamide-nucleotide amidase
MLATETSIHKTFYRIYTLFGYFAQGFCRVPNFHNVLIIICLRKKAKSRFTRNLGQNSTIAYDGFYRISTIFTFFDFELSLKPEPIKLRGIMSDNINAEIIAIGTEILLGEITDTNSVYIAQQLRHLGINLYFMTSVGDNEARIESAIRLALSRAELVITCGGLGPTVDDMTRQAVAAATDRGLSYHEDLYQQIVDRFASFKVQMTGNNKRQAYLPDRAIAIENPVGTAPSFIVELGDRAIISLPGVPRELKFLFTEKVIPYLREKYDLGIIKAHTLKTAGIGESTLDEMLGDELLNNTNPSIGLAAHHGVIDVRITAKASTENEADALIAIMEKDIRAKVGDFIFGTNDEELEEVLIASLQKYGLSLAIAEAGIDEAAIAKIHAAAGHNILSEAYTANHPDVAIAAFNLDGMTLRQSAETIARTLAERNQSAAGIAILSLPDVDEKADIEEASAIALYVNGEIKSRIYGFGGNNPITRDWLSRWALAYIWRLLKEQYEKLG